MKRTNIVTTRMGIYFKGLATESFVEKRLALAHQIGIPAFEQVTTDWHWVWMVAPERYDQVVEGAPDYVHVIKQQMRPDGRPLPPGAPPNPKDVADIPGDRFLTARLDSDDAWLPSTWDWVASQEWEPSTLIDFARGWTWDINADLVGHYGFRDNKQGHYLAITNESREKMIYPGGNHIKARRGIKNLHHDRENRRWLQVVHGGNVWGKWRAKQKLSRPEGTRILEQFGIDREEARKAAAGAGGGAGRKVWQS